MALPRFGAGDGPAPTTGDVMRHGLKIACLLSAAALTGCGGSSDDSNSKTDPLARTTATSDHAAGAEIGTSGFSAVRPSDWTDSTSTAPKNTTSGRPPDLQMLGPVTAGVHDVIQVDRLTLSATGPLDAVVEQTRDSHRSSGHALDPTGVRKSKIDGETAYVYGVQYEVSGRAQHHALVFVRHGSTDYLFLFIASPAAYKRDFGTFASFIDSVRWA